MLVILVICEGFVFSAEAASKYGKHNLKVYSSSFVPLFHGITKRKPKTHMKLICLLPEEKVCKTSLFNNTLLQCGFAQIWNQPIISEYFSVLENGSDCR